MWAACGESGLFRSTAGAFEASRLVRSRDGEWAVALSENPLGYTVFVSWRDGIVEELDTHGNLVATWNVGSFFRVERTSPHVAALHSHEETARLWDIETHTEVDIAGRVCQLWWDGNRTLVAASADGAYAVERRDNELVLERLLVDEVTGIASDSSGVIWLSSQPIGIGRLSPTLQLSTWIGRPGPDDRYIGVSDEWVATVTWFGAELSALPTANPADNTIIRAMLPGVGMGVVVRNDFAVVGLRRWGVTSVPLDQGSWPDVIALRLPIGRLWGRGDSNRLCATPNGVMVTLEEAGIALVDVDEVGQLTLDRLIDTPGRAVDCTMTDQPNTYLIADTTALLEVVLE